MDDEILIVDDEKMILSCFERLLGRRFRLFVALGAKEALESIALNGPFAVILSDMQMPGMNGVELLVKAKELSPATIGLLLSGNAPVKEGGDVCSFDGMTFKYLQKPCPSDKLVLALEGALQQHRELRARLNP